ncbi:MAG: PHP domain-containing protein [Alkaliphilus sp.]|nr:PHP domain-containing protein [Alkaliphilus sp.]
MSRLDMHIHTTKSDGILTPEQVVVWSNKIGLKGIAITDHDTVDGIEEGIATAKSIKDFILIPGIEFSSIYNNHEIHILGYFIDYTNSKLVSITDKIKEYRANRANKTIEALKELNIEIDIKDVNPGGKKKSIGRPHIARALIEKGYVENVQEAFEKYLSKGRPAYISRYKLSLMDSIKIIKASKGIPVLAHPGLLDKSVNVLEILDLGLEGIEVYHTDHSKEDSLKYFALAKQRDLLITGGSDYHYTFEGNIPCIGKTTIPFEFIKKHLNF